MSNKPTVTFIRVENNKTKVLRICATIYQQFSQGKKVFISVPSDAAAQYLDKLLWSTPQESFLPHEVSSAKSKQKVVISTKRENLNDAEILINLCTDTNPHYQSFRKIYELWDITDPAKEEHSQQRRAKYKELELDCFIEG